jgi:hypothetical protein
VEPFRQETGQGWKGRLGGEGRGGVEGEGFRRGGRESLLAREKAGFDPAPNVEPFRQETAGGWKGGGGLCFKGEHGGGGELQGGAVTRVCLLRLKVESWVAVRTWAAAPSRSALYTVCTPSLASRAEAAPT